MQRRTGMCRLRAKKFWSVPCISASAILLPFFVRSADCASWPTPLDVPECVVIGGPVIGLGGRTCASSFSIAVRYLTVSRGIFRRRALVPRAAAERARAASTRATRATWGAHDFLRSTPPPTVRVRFQGSTDQSAKPRPARAGLNRDGGSNGPSGSYTRAWQAGRDRRHQARRGRQSSGWKSHSAASCRNAAKHPANISRIRGASAISGSPIQPATGSKFHDTLTGVINCFHLARFRPSLVHRPRCRIAAWRRGARHRQVR